MVLTDIGHPVDVGAIRELLEAGRLHLADEHIDPRRHPRQSLARPRVAGEDNASPRGVKAVAVSLAPLAVVDEKRGNPDAAAVIDDTRAGFMDGDAVTVGRSVLKSSRANADVFAECRIEVVDHRGEAVRAVDRERSRAAHHPRREHQVREAEHMIAVEMRDEGRRHPVDWEGRRRPGGARPAGARPTPEPASTRNTRVPTTIAVAGPDASGRGRGVPVPSMTTSVV